MRLGMVNFNLLYSYNFSPLVNVATEETSNTSSTCFDYIWFHKYNVSKAGSIIVDALDHCSIFPRGSSQNFGIFFIIGPILLKFSHNM